MWRKMVVGHNVTKLAQTDRAEVTGERRLGNHDAAFANMRKIASIIPQSRGPLSLTDVFTVAQAEIYLNAGLVEDAISLAEKALTIAESVGSLSSLGQAHQLLGIALARTTSPPWSEVDAHLEKSLHVLEEGEFKLEVARTHLAWGLLQRARHNRTAALEHLKQAASQFETSSLTRELGFAREAMEGLLLAVNFAAKERIDS
jgi:tetratricopeptide (TPR) repeat protein